MALNEKLTRNELLLPNIIFCNGMLVETRRVDDGNQAADVKTRFPNLQIASEPGKLPKYVCLGKVRNRSLSLFSEVFEYVLRVTLISVLYVQIFDSF